MSWQYPTLKKEATRPPGMNSLQQQDRFDAFIREFNTERPREALAMKCPPIWRANASGRQKRSRYPCSPAESASLRRLRKRRSLP